MRPPSLDHWAVLFEMYYRDLTARQTTPVLGVPEGTVKSRVQYSLYALREAELLLRVEA